MRRGEQARGTVHQRYTYRWSEFSKAWLPNHPLCGMRSDGRVNTEHRRPTCTCAVAECTDHIIPMSMG